MGTTLRCNRLKKRAPSLLQMRKWASLNAFTVAQTFWKSRAAGVSLGPPMAARHFLLVPARNHRGEDFNEGHVVLLTNK